MKIVCKKNIPRGVIPNYHVTIGKVYEVDDRDWKYNEVIFVVDDRGESNPFPKSYFRDLYVARKQKIDDFLDSTD